MLTHLSLMSNFRNNICKELATGERSHLGLLTEISSKKRNEKRNVTPDVPKLKADSSNEYVRHIWVKINLHEKC